MPTPAVGGPAQSPQQAKDKQMERVTFQNKGNTVAGSLFKPDGAGQGTKYPAIVVTHPFGAVKEQVPATYAKLLAGQGFITLVVDASCQGESGGEPHFSEFPSARVEDIRRAVDFLSTRPDVDPYRAGLLQRSGRARTREAAGGEVEMFSLINDNPAFAMNDPSTIP
jgi:fermentation-respiration switch protein FrsA (DUF1100 family)